MMRKKESSGVKSRLLIKRSPGLNKASFKIDSYAIKATADATLTITARDQSSKSPKDREVRLMVEVRDIIPSSLSITKRKLSVQACKA